MLPERASEHSPEEHLERIQAITDAALVHLDVDDLLTEVLDRVVDLLDADTASVLLLDERSQELVATATRGIEEEVLQNVRVPMGEGFAGRVAAGRQPVILDKVDETTVWNPILWQKGIKSMVGVPMLSAGVVVGVLHVGAYAPREFTADQVELLQVAAERVAGAMRARLAEADRLAARRLQRSLLPGLLPRHDELQFAARYAAAEEGVGGDWYDVFELPSGAMWVVSGDVAGHGLDAAVVMGRLKSALRAYALQGGSPDEVLALTDRKLLHFEPNHMATVVCAAIEPPFDTMLIASAGHPPPVLAVPDQPTVLVDVAGGPPLGATPDFVRESTKLDFRRGSVVVLYTDGLVERRHELLDVGFERLRTAVTADHPEIVCRRAMGLVGDRSPEDDVAVLAVRRVPAV